MQLDDLHLFARLAQAHSLSEAARQLGQTPAAVSARLKRMEQELDVRLIERTTRTLRLTPEGERFLQTCDIMTTAWTQGQSLLRQGARGLTGRIDIAAPSDTSTQFLGPWLADYAALHPRLTITLHVGDRMHDLPREAVDIAIRYGELADSSLVMRNLIKSQRVLVAAPAYVERSAPVAAPADLANHVCLAWLSRDQPNVQWTFQSPSGAAETVIVKPALCADGLVVRQWALAGRGIAYKALVDVATDIREGRLVRLLPDHAGESAPIRAVMPSARYLPARVRGLLEYLAARFGAL